MKKVGLFISFLLVIGLIISGCTSPTLPQPTPWPTASPTPQPTASTQETRLKFWTDPEVVPHEPYGWMYNGYVTIEGNEAVTLTSLDLYEKETQNSSFVFKGTSNQAEIASWPGWKTYLVPGDKIAFTAGFYATMPPYQKKFILHGITDSGKAVSVETIVTFLP